MNLLKELLVFRMLFFLTPVFVILSGLVGMKGKRMLPTRYCHRKISGHWRNIRNTIVDIDQWNTPCVVYIPIFFILLKLNISFIVHVSSFEGIILSIRVVYDLEVLAQIDTACARVDCYCIHNMRQYKLDLSPSSQRWRPNFPFFFARRPCTVAELMTLLFIKAHC